MGVYSIEIDMRLAVARAWVAEYVSNGVSARHSISDLLLDAFIAGHKSGTAQNTESPATPSNKQSTKLCRSCIKLWPCVAAGENIETCDCYEAMA